jgi:hypothetical protein
MFEESAKDGGEDAKGVKLRTRMQARLGEILARKAEAKNGAAAAQGGKPPAVPSRSPKNKVRRHLLGGHGPRHFCGYFSRGRMALFFPCACSLCHSFLLMMWTLLPGECDGRRKAGQQPSGRWSARAAATAAFSVSIKGSETPTNQSSCR